MILYGADRDIADWVENELFGTKTGYFGECRSIGNVIDGKLIAGTVFNNLKTFPDGTPHVIDMNIATIDKRWASRAYLVAIFKYSFTDLRVKRVQIITSIHNEGINSVVSRLGFIKEGEHKQAAADGGDAFSWRMLKSECGWLV